MRTKEELKKIAQKAIEERREDIFKFYDSVYNEPELGFKEVKTSQKFQDVLSSLSLPMKKDIALTGVTASVKGNGDKINVALMGELDAIVVKSHKDADKLTGAVHACGHAAQLSSVVASAYALCDTDIMKDLGGTVTFMATPAEEYIEMDYRTKLREEGKIHFLCGKQEMIRLGCFDDVDISIMQHTTIVNDTYTCGATSVNNGFVGKMVKYTGKAAHGGAAPWEGINALNACMLGLNAVHAQRETFKDEDHIRVHPIITKGGDIVNVVPDDVRVETYVRGSSTKAILDASKKVDRALTSGAVAVGAEVEIKTFPGDLPCVQSEMLNDLMFENMKELSGDKAIKYCTGFGGGSSDQGDVSHIIPSIQSYFAGAAGGLHQESYSLVDKENAIINAAKSMVMTVIDLLYDDAKLGQEVKKNFLPVMTKEEYLDKWGNLK